MKRLVLIALVLCGLIGAAPLRAAEPLGTAFTYQGALTVGTAAANGSYDFAFKLFDAEAGGAMVGNELLRPEVVVSNGLFHVSLDFGVGVFNGQARWLELAVRATGEPTFTSLTPRQPLSPAPYAQFSPVAGVAGVADALSGTLPESQLPPGVARLNASQTFTGANELLNPGNAFAGNGAGLTGLNASSLGSGTVPDARLSANVPLLDSSPIFTGNLTASGDLLAVGDVRGSRLNIGAGHLLSGTGATIAGGAGHTNRGQYSVIGGGKGNWIDQNSWYAVIAGGDSNIIRSNTWECVISGGTSNVILHVVTNATISGGAQNLIQNQANGANIGGGTQNAIQSNSVAATVGGGVKNLIRSNSPSATVAGGLENTIYQDSVNAVIGGGNANTIQDNAWETVIGGGVLNLIQSYSSFAFIGGGHSNVVGPQSLHALITGGQDNRIVGLADAATIGGGGWNLVLPNADYSTIPGGSSNVVGGSYSLAAGQNAQALHQGAFVWADSTPGPFASTANNQFLIRATGGVGVGAPPAAGFALDVAGAARATSFTGNGSGLTSLDAGAITTGTLSEARIPSSIARDAEVMGLVLAGDGAGSGLDADLLDGQHASAFAAAAHNHDAAYWNLLGNNIVAGNFLGTLNNFALELRANNATALRLQPNATSPNVIGGAGANSVLAGAAGATIGGGGQASAPNRVTRDFGTVAGGSQNTVSGVFATIGGGTTNAILPGAGSADPAVKYATIGGGWGNAVQDWASTIGGGGWNTNYPGAYQATIAGGYGNSIQSRYSSIGGGSQNRIGWEESYASTISGGFGNTITNAYGAGVGGGMGNTILDFSNGGTVAGGFNNLLLPGANNGTVGGGYGNIVCAPYATVPGGYSNTACGWFGLAAGQRAKAFHTGSFVWADATPADFASTASNQFLVRAVGGVGINKNAPTSALDVNGTVTATAFVGSGGGLTGLDASAITSGVFADARIPSTIARDAEVMGLVLAGDGAGSGLDADLLDGQHASAFAPAAHNHDSTYWKLRGNALVTGDFLGSLNNQPVDFKVNNVRAFRLEPTAQAGAVNVVGGSPNNTVLPGIFGATIAGGGDPLSGPANTVEANLGTIGGGTENEVSNGANYATVGGGLHNWIGIHAVAATISGGAANEVLPGAEFAVIPGGHFNIAGGSLSLAAGYKAGAMHPGAFVWADTAAGTNFNSTAPNQFLVRAVGGVGINRNNPAYPLDVNGAVRATTFIGDGSLLTGVPCTVPDNSITAAKLASDTASLAKVTGGNAAVSGGNIGIGTAAPVARLDVRDGVGDNGTIHVGGAVANGNPKLIKFGDSDYVYVGENGADDRLELKGTVVHVNSSYVGVGRSDPSYALDVNGTVRATAFLGDGSGLTGVTATVADGSITTAKLANNAVTSAKIADGTILSADIADATIATTDLADSSVTSAKLLDGTVTSVDIADGTIATADLANSSVTSAKIADGTVANADLANDAASLSKVTAGNAVVSGSNIGIGTASPAARLDVRDGVGDNGTIHVGGTGYNGNPKLVKFGDGDLVYVGENGADDRMELRASEFYFNIGDVGMGRLSAANRLEVEGNASKTTAGSWLANSDARIKTGIATVTNALDTLSRVRLVQFRYTDDYRAEHTAIEDRPYLNVVAQEFQKVFPEYVKGSGETLDGQEILQVDSYPLTIYTAAAVQELQAQLHARDAEIQALKAAVAELRSLVSPSRPAAQP